MIRLFVAIELPGDVRARLAALCVGVPGAKWVKAENLHLTLRFIGEVDGHRFEDIAAALGEVRAPAFDVALDGVGFFGGRRPRVLWAGVARTAALDHLHAKVESALVRAGCEPEGRKFTPHITLARLNNAPAGRVRGFVSDHNLFRAGPFPATEFTLFSSFLSQEGALHTPEAVYPLSPAEP